MDDATITAHLDSLGARPRVEALGDGVWEAMGLRRDSVPHDLRWLLDHYAGTGFSRGAVLRENGVPVVDVGWILGADELAEAWEDTRDCLPPGALPFTEDGGGDHVCADLGSGAVLLHVHDAPLGEAHLRPVADSIETFLLALEPSAD